MSDYARIEKAIGYITDHVSEQPSLEQIAEHVHLSPFHFQRLFCRWAGITPKKFLQVMTLERGKAMLASSSSLLDLSYRLGLSSGSRLHDHFVQIEAVTPGEYRTGGKGLVLRYGVATSPFGRIFLASTERGICRAAFLDAQEDEASLLRELGRTWPQASLIQDTQAAAQAMARMFNTDAGADRPLALHVSGTNFQVAVWKALLAVPPGALTSYSRLAKALGQPRSSRAIGNAVGANPIAFIIPCHRVIQESGALGGYRWGPARKQALQFWEQLRLPAEHAQLES